MHAVAQNTAWPYPCWIAHRGAGELAPENTMAAFRLGAEHGFAMFECDVKLSADGEPFLLHDTERDRTADGGGGGGRQGAAGMAVLDDGSAQGGLQTWDALSRLDAGGWHGRPYAGEPWLRLEALARWLQALGMMVNLEIKPTPGDEVRTGRVVAQHVARLWSLAHVKPLLSSFSTVALEAARQTQPDLPRALLQDEWADDSIKTAVRLGCLALVVNHTHLNAERIAAIHDAGLKALSYTVNQASRASMLWRAGLDGLITDRVDVFEPQARLGANPARLMVEAEAWMA